MSAQIFFLGAAYRTTMAEHFLREIRDLELQDVRLSSIELETPILPPISDFMPISFGPLFGAPEFQELLTNLILNHKQVLFIPFMDSACRALSSWGMNQQNQDYFFGSNDAWKITDKSLLAEHCLQLGIATPIFSGTTEYVIIKPRLGFGSRDQFIKPTEDFLNNPGINLTEFVVQDLIVGSETSIDVYVSKENIFCAIARDRIQISDGEVVETRTRNLTLDEYEIVNQLVQNTHLRGPINVQLIGTEKLLLDLNPRFSGGSTASIHAGWNAIRWLINEYLFENEIVFPSTFNHVHVIRSKRDHVRTIL